MLVYMNCLHFTMGDKVLFLHNYRQHNQHIALAKLISVSPSINLIPNSFAYELVENALKEEKPDVFLNQKFKLHGFFRF